MLLVLCASACEKVGKSEVSADGSTPSESPSSASGHSGSAGDNPGGTPGGQHGGGGNGGNATTPDQHSDAGQQGSAADAVRVCAGDEQFVSCVANCGDPTINQSPASATCVGGVYSCVTGLTPAIDCPDGSWPDGQGCGPWVTGYDCGGGSEGVCNDGIWECGAGPSRLDGGPGTPEASARVCAANAEFVSCVHICGESTVNHATTTAACSDGKYSCGNGLVPANECPTDSWPEGQECGPWATGHDCGGGQVGVCHDGIWACGLRADGGL